MRVKKPWALALIFITIMNIGVAFAGTLPPQEESILIEDLIRDTLQTSSACGCDIKEIMKTFAEINRRMTSYKKANVDIYKRLQRYMERLLKLAKEESQSSGISLLQTASAQTASVVTAAFLDFLDEFSGFMLEEFSELGAAATAGRGIYRSMKIGKAGAKSTGAYMGLEKFFDAKKGTYAIPLPPSFVKLMKELASNLDHIITLQRLEREFWNRIYENKDCLKRLEGLCKAEKININDYKQNTLQDTLNATPVNPLYWTSTEEAISEVWGLKALGEELGFSRERDDPLSIKNYVIPQLRQWREKGQEIERLYNASNGVDRKIKAIERCQLCESLRNLKILHDLEQEVYSTALSIRKYIFDHQRMIFSSYKDLQRLWKKSASATKWEAAVASPPYVLTTTALSLLVPWSGTGFAAIEAGIKLMLDITDKLVKSGVDEEIRNDIKKFNFQVSLLKDWKFLGKISSAEEILTKAKEDLLKSIEKCETDRCIEDRFSLIMPEPHKVRAVLSHAIEGLQGCWVGGIGIYIEKASTGYKAWYVWQSKEPPQDVSFQDALKYVLPNKKIPMDVSFHDGLMVLTHRINEKTLPIWLDHVRSDIKDEARCVLGEELEVKLRPYEARSGLISALAYRVEHHPPYAFCNGHRLIGTAWSNVPLNKFKFALKPVALKILDASTRKEISEIQYGQKIILQANIEREVNCPVERDLVFARISPQADPTLGKRIALRETGKTTGIVESSPFIVDFYLPGKRSDSVSFTLDIAHTPANFGDLPGGDLKVTIKGVGDIRPIEPGSEEALRYALASQISIQHEEHEAVEYAQLDPLFGLEKGDQAYITPEMLNLPQNMTGPYNPPAVNPPVVNPPVVNPPGVNPPTVNPPAGNPPAGKSPAGKSPVVRFSPLSIYKEEAAGKSAIPEAYLKKVPVKVPIDINKINWGLIKDSWQSIKSQLKRDDERYRKIKSLTEKPEWADPRIRQLWIYKMQYKEARKSYEGSKAVLKDYSSQDKKQMERIILDEEKLLKSLSQRIKELESSLKKTPPVLYKKPVTKKLLFEGYKIHFVSEKPRPVLITIKRRFYQVGDGYELIETEHPVNLVVDKNGAVIWGVDLKSGKEISHLLAVDTKEAETLLRQHKSDMTSYLSKDTVLRKIQDIYGPEARPLE